MTCKIVGKFQFTAQPADGFIIGKMIEAGKQQVQIGNRDLYGHSTLRWS